MVANEKGAEKIVEFAQLSLDKIKAYENSN